uniref:O-methyltransferase domain-containing protein n=1 Tax=Leersia perrieri TaxID=77586 RepID=A0A0D9W2B2_9ORYZ
MTSPSFECRPSHHGHPVESARRSIMTLVAALHAVASRTSKPCVKHIAGNMFESVPNGDAVFLKSMLHLHNDEDCIKILKNCHQAVPNNGKVIAVEIVVPAIPEPVPAARNPFEMDMIMLNNFRGGKERTELEFAKLGMDSGFGGAFRTTYILANYRALEFNKYNSAGGVAAGDADDEATFLHSLELICSFVVPMTLKAAVELGLLDALTTAADGRALTAAELAAQLPAADKAEAACSVDRMLRLLASYNVVRCSTEAGPGGEALRRYSPAPVCRWFAGNNSRGSLAPMVKFVVDEDYLSSWHHLGAAVAGGGQSGFERAHRMPIFEYIGTNSHLNTVFNQAMAQHSEILMSKLLERFHGFDDIGVLVDVGGGTGTTLQMITSRYKHIIGVNFDLPHVIAQAPTLPGVKHIAGNMFESIPTGDAVFLKSMFHLQSDENCIKILKNCHQALPNNGKVIAVEIVLPEIPEPVPAAQNPFQMDMIMLNNFKGGKERTELEFAKLAMDSGFSGGFRATYILANYRALEFSK